MFVFHSKLNVRANRIKMRVESRNKFVVENTKRVINIPQPMIAHYVSYSSQPLVEVY